MVVVVVVVVAPPSHDDGRAGGLEGWNLEVEGECIGEGGCA